MIASLYVPIFTDLGRTSGAVVGLILFTAMLLMFSLFARTETGWLAGVVLAVLGAAVLGVALWFGCWPLA